MKKHFTKFLLYCSFLTGINVAAQVDPGTANLKHQWTFDDGSANDVIGNLTGTLMGAATVSNKALNTTNGGHLSFNGSNLDITSYPELTTELWFKSASGQNTGNTMILYLGDADVDGWKGTNYIYASPSNGGNCRLAISTGNTSSPWQAEDGVNRAQGAIDDGILHHMVSVINATSITLFIDGVNVGTTNLTGTNAISTVSSATAFLCKSGYSSDPTWRGYIHKFSIYNKALTDEEVEFLHLQGAESDTFIDASKSSLSFDESNTSISLTVSASNLSEAITIEAPAGISVNPETLPADASNSNITVTYDGTSIIDDNITLSSGSTVLKIPVKASQNADCFTPLYTEVPNLIPDPYMNSTIGAWGNVSVISGAEVYCGSHCVKITGTASCYPNGGSVASNNITWLPNTTYRFHAKVKTMDGAFNMGVQNANVNGSSGDYNILVPHTYGRWEDFDATFTTGSSPTSGVAFFNNCGSASGQIAYIDNWELYTVPGISTSENTLYVDEITNTASFRVTGIGLSEPIAITIPTGCTISQNTLSADASGVTLTLTYDGQTEINEDIILQSEEYNTTIAVEASNNSNCYEPIYPDGTNLITDPYLTDLTNFSGSGARSINKDPRYAYCGVSSGQVTGNGSITQNLTGTLKPNTTYRVKAKVYRKNPGNVTYTMAIDPVAHPTEYQLIKTAMDSACYYFNKYTPFSANVYVYLDAGIPTAQASYYGSMGFGTNQRYMWVGTAMHELDHYFGSGTTSAWQSLIVNGKWQGASANALASKFTNGQTTSISGDMQHFWPFGINQKEEITNLGSQASQEKGLIEAVQIAKAMLVDDAKLVPDFNPVGIGIHGWDGNAADIYHEITELEGWQDVDFTFTTGSTLGNSQTVFFNSGSGYIDNWEMYEVPVNTDGKDISENHPHNIYTTGNTIITEYYLPKSSEVHLLLYDIQGKLLLDKKATGVAGNNRTTLNTSLGNGIYVVKLITNHQVMSSKIKK